MRLLYRESNIEHKQIPKRYLSDDEYYQSAQPFFFFFGGGGGGI